jgi:hypothetical protein
MHIGDLVGAVAVPEHQVRRPARPGQHVGRVVARVTRATLTVHPAATLRTLVMPLRNSMIMVLTLAIRDIPHFSQSEGKLMLEVMVTGGRLGFPTGPVG